MLWYELHRLWHWCLFSSCIRMIPLSIFVSDCLKCENVPCTICGSDHCNRHFFYIDKHSPIISWDDLRSDWYWLMSLLILVDKLTSLCLLPYGYPYRLFNLHEESYWTFGVFLLHDVPSNVSSVFALVQNENITAFISNLMIMYLLSRHIVLSLALVH